MSPYKDEEVRKLYHKNYGAAHYRANKESYKARLSTPERNAQRRAFAKNNPEHLALQRRVCKFGAMPGFDRVKEMLMSGDVSCEACGSPSPNSKKGWCVDHDHERQVVRGVLCPACNVALGHAKDSIHRLEQLICYLEKNQGAFFEVPSKN